MDFSEIFPGVAMSQVATNGEFVVFCNQAKIIIKELPSLHQIPLTVNEKVKITHIEISPNCRFLAMNLGQRVEIRRIADDQVVARIEENQLIESIHWSPDSSSVLCVSEEKLKLGIYSISDSTIAHIRGPKQFAFSPDGKFIAVTERRETKDYYGIYSTKDWKLLNYQPCETFDCQSIQWCSKGFNLVITDSVLQYRVNVLCPSQGVQQKFESDPYGVRVTKISNSGDLLAFGGGDDKLLIVNMLTLTVAIEITDKEKPELIFKEEEYQDQYQIKTLTRYTLDTVYKLPKSPLGGISMIEWSPSDDLLAFKTDTYPNIVYIWDAVEFKLIVALQHLEKVKSFKWSDKEMLAICTGTSKLFFYNTSGGSVVDLQDYIRYLFASMIACLSVIIGFEASIFYSWVIRNPVLGSLNMISCGLGYL